MRSEVVRRVPAHHAGPVASHERCVQPIVDLATGEVRAVRLLPDVDHPRRPPRDPAAAAEPPHHALDVVAGRERFGVPVLVDVALDQLTNPALTAALAPHVDRGCRDRLVARVRIDRAVRSPLRVQQGVAALRRLGLGIVMAEFGIAWSNLGALRAVVPDAVEVSLLTVRRWPTPEVGLDWVCRLGRGVGGGPTIVSGIASAAQAGFARAQGATLGAGPWWPLVELPPPRRP